MASRGKQLLLAIAVSISALQALAAEDKPKSPSPRKPSIAQLIDHLNSEDFETREKATRALLNREDALPALRRAARSSSLEVRRRAQQILEAQLVRVRKQQKQRLLVYLKNGQVDRFVDLMVLTHQEIDDDIYCGIKDLVARVVTQGNKEQFVKWKAPNFDKPWYDKRPGWCMNRGKFPSRDCVAGWVAVERKVVGRVSISFSLLVVQDSLQLPVDISDSIVFVNGDIVGPKVCVMRGCVVICDGSICDDSLKSQVGSGLFLASGDIRKSFGPIARRNAREALGIVKFYDPREAGVEVASSREGLVVKNVLTGKPLARAGIHKGDRVLAIGGTKVGSIPALRRLLRRYTVAREPVAVAVERPGKGRLELTVALSD